MNHNFRDCKKVHIIEVPIIGCIGKQGVKFASCIYGLACNGRAAFASVNDKKKRPVAAEPNPSSLKVEV